MKIERIYKYLTGIYVFCVIAVMALFFDNNYFNIVGAKAVIFRVVASALAAVTLICFAVQLINKAREKSLSKRLTLSTVDIGVCMVALCAILSCIFSQHLYEAFTGESGWQTGTITYLLLTVLYFCVSRSYESKTWQLIAVSAVQSVIYLWAILNSCNVDVFNMHEGIYGENSQYLYLASIGNANSLGTYLCMLLMFSVGMLALYRTKKSISVLLYVNVFLGFVCAFTCNCDSVFVGLFFAMLALIYFCIKRDSAIKIGIVSFLLGTAGAAVKLLSIVVPGFVGLNGISGFIINNYLWLYLLIVSSVFIAFASKFPDFFIKNKDVLKWLAVGMGVIGAIAVVVVSAVSFNDSWGSYRGYIWKAGIEMYSGLPLKNKLFGVGTDCFGIYFSQAYNQQMHEIWGVKVLNAHNEFLQTLITHGAFGLISWLFLWVALFKKRVADKPLSCALYIGLSAYFAQSFFNVPYTYNLALLFLLISISEAKTAEKGICESVSHQLRVGLKNS